MGRPKGHKLSEESKAKISETKKRKAYSMLEAEYERINKEYMNSMPNDNFDFHQHILDTVRLNDAMEAISPFRSEAVEKEFNKIEKACSDRISRIQKKYMLTDDTLINLRGVNEMIAYEKLLRKDMSLTPPAMGSEYVSVSVYEESLIDPNYRVAEFDPTNR